MRFIRTINQAFHNKLISGCLGSSMDGFDLFKKLGSGARFDYKRFRSDAERLHILKPQIHQEKQKLSETNLTPDAGKDSDSKQLQQLPAAEQSTDTDSSSSDDSDSEEEIEDVAVKQEVPSDETEANNMDQEASSDSDSGETSSDSDSEDSRDSEPELQLLGSMKAKGDVTMNTKNVERKLIKKKKKVHSAEKLAALKQEQANHIRNVHRVSAIGTDVPNPFDSFEQLGTEYKFHPQILQNIQTAGYEKPTPIQVQAIPVMLHRREIMACAPTGSGKTAAFILPILHHLKEPRNQGIRALTLAPTRELAKQTYREFQRLSEGMGFKLLYIDKVGKDPASLKKALKKIDILVSTPNRLIYLLKQEPVVISLSSVQWLVVDESDKLFEDGKTGFRDQLATIYKACDGTNVRRAMFSATFAFDVEEWCKLNLDNVIQVYIGMRNAATKTIEQSLVFCGAESGKLMAMRDIIRKGIQPPVLVFVQSKERAKELFHELLYDGMNVDVIHADRTQQQRDNVIKCFRERKIWILICTELMGRGIDFKGVNLVINYDFPNSAISYIHKIGRTGRAGRQGKAVTFFTEDDSVNLRSIANVMIMAGCPVPEYMLKMRRPDKKLRRKLAQSAPYREKISTTASYDIQKAKRLRRMVAGTKMRTLHQQGKTDTPSDGQTSKTATVKSLKRKNTDSSDKDAKKPKPDGNNKSFEKSKSKKKFHKGLNFRRQGNKFRQFRHSGHKKGKGKAKGAKGAGES